MKKLYKLALMASLGLAGIATGQAATYNGDLLVGFTVGSGNDLIYDLGTESSLTDGQTWDLSSLISGFDLNAVNWGVIGSSSAYSPKEAWATYDGNSISGSQQWTALNNPAVDMYGYFSSAGPGQSTTMAFNDTPNTWYEQTIAGPLGTSYVNENGNPNAIGLTSDLFYQYIADGSTPTLLGGFSLNSNEGVDTLTFNAVPEPSTCGMLVLGGLLAVSLRRQFFRKQA